MTATDIRKLIIWLHSCNQEQFYQTVYGGLVRPEKWKKFQKNPLSLLGELDTSNLKRVAAAASEVKV